MNGMKQIKPYIYLFVSILLVLSVISPNLFALGLADDQKLVKEAQSETGGDVANLIEKVKGFDFTKEDKILSVLTYMFSTGHYMENVDRGVMGDKVDKTVVHDFNGHKSICGFNDEPQNLLNHNCDIPTLTTALAQRFSDLGALQGLQNAGTTTAKAPFGLGVPAGLPNDKVPVNPKERTDKYTALELYGYNLQYTNYNGEWDNIEVSTEARLLSNFGFFNAMQLAGSAIFNGLTSAFMELFKDFNWNPLKWFANVADAGASAALWTIIDTSDMNVATTHKWKRPTFASTVYNAHYLSDKEIAEKAQQDFLDYFQSELEARAMQKPDIKKVFRLKKDSDEWPVFVYDPHVETEASIKAREAAEAHNASNPDNQVPVPEPVYETEEEQFARWKQEEPQSSYYAEAKGVGIPCPDKSTYGAVRECWDIPWRTYAKKKIKNNDPTIQQIIKDIEDDFSNKNPHYDPNRSIAHWVCAKEDGSVSGKVEYVYSDENTRESENVNSCGVVRPSIQGGLYGTGLGEKGITDTRWKLFKRFQANTTQAGTSSIWRTIAKGITIITNTLLSLSFSNILTALQVPKLVEKVVVAFRDSLYFPFSVFCAALFALFVMLKIFKDFSMVNAFMSIGYLLFIFIICGAILTKPQYMTKAVEEVPTAIDNFLATAILGTKEEEQSSSQMLCSNTGGKNNAIRSMACFVWEINIFTPWVQGQWGTTFENLDSDKMNNNNSTLVGDASVDMGNNTIMNNWAIFQLSRMKSGTITDVDKAGKEGIVQKGLYKVVDLQAGPNNGKDSDARYLETWSGITGKRDSYSFRSMLISIAMLVLVGGFAVLKIETSLMFALLLMISPIMATVALFPGGKRKFLEYVGELGRLLLQRTFITLILLISLLLIKTVISSNSYNTIFVFVLILAVTTRMYYKDIINLMTGCAKSSFGMEMGELREKAKNATPNTFKRKLNMFKRSSAEATAGAVGGGVAGVINSLRYAKEGVVVYDHNGKKVNPFTSSVKKGASDGWKRGGNFEFNKQRRAGFGTLDQLFISNEDAKKAINKENADKKSQLRVTTDSLREVMKENLRKKNVDVETAKSEYNRTKEAYIELLTKKESASGTPLGDNNDAQNEIDKLELELQEKNKILENAVYQQAVSASAITLLDKLQQSNFQNLTPELNRILRSYSPDKKYIQQDEDGNMLYSISEAKAAEEFISRLTKYAYEEYELETYSIRADLKNRFGRNKQYNKENESGTNEDYDDDLPFNNGEKTTSGKHRVTDEDSKDAKTQRKILQGLGSILEKANPLDKKFVMNTKKGLIGSILTEEDTYDTLFGNDTDKLNKVLQGDKLPDEDSNIFNQDDFEEKRKMFDQEEKEGVDKYFNNTAEQFGRQKIFNNNFDDSDDEIYDFSKPQIDLEDENSVSNFKGKKVTTLREELSNIEDTIRERIVGQEEDNTNEKPVFRNLNQTVSVNDAVVSEDAKIQFDQNNKTRVKTAEVLVEDVIQNTNDSDLLKENEYFRNSMSQLFMLADSLDNTTKPKVDSINKKENVAVIEDRGKLFKEMMVNLLAGKEVHTASKNLSSKGKIEQDNNTGAKEFKSRRNRGGRR